MKKLVFLTIIFSAVLFGAKAQQQQEQETPDEQIIVNKKYDEDGNLIEYDSTYIHQWSRDTTFHFGVPGDSLSFQYNFPGIERFMDEFWNDSLFGNRDFPHQPFSFGFRFSPFDDENFRKHQLPFADSLFSNQFPFQFDSLFFDFGFEPGEKLPPGFDHDFFEDFEKRLNRHFFRFRDENFGFPGFKNEEHRKEWEELMQKHQRELEELQKKWQKNDPPDKKL
ncbi:MAG: hypothetical protein ACP5D9_11400 [Mariniphaga sp.]